uniref:Uncharacterized protein LOC105037731 isoform X2 n=1 Tax=Elaeis guineensis var. tenera TaxID=51953 RepID=A0A8N4F0D7_ELAGV|nr:uncharacterized protein LOC105037731 isoform X2 [Elaeis guineensis]
MRSYPNARHARWNVHAFRMIQQFYLLKRRTKRKRNQHYCSFGVKAQNATHFSGVIGFHMGAFSVNCDAVDPVDVTAVASTVKKDYSVRLVRGGDDDIELVGGGDKLVLHSIGAINYGNISTILSIC